MKIFIVEGFVPDNGARQSVDFIAIAPALTEAEAESKVKPAAIEFAKKARQDLKFDAPFLRCHEFDPMRDQCHIARLHSF